MKYSFEISLSLGNITNTAIVQQSSKNNKNFFGDMVNAESNKPSSSLNAKEIDIHDEMLNPSKSPNSNSSSFDDDFHFKADGFCFIGSNNLDKNFGCENQMLKDTKLQRELSKKLEEPKKFPRQFTRKLSEPIYETIPELTGSDDCHQGDYALPVDDVKQMVFTKSNNLKTKSNNHDKTSKLFCLNSVPRSATFYSYDQSEGHTHKDDFPEE